KSMKVEDGFKIKLVASEPLISSPVAMAFDDSLHLWVVEMRDFQPLPKLAKKPLPSGKIVILSDVDGDGVMDSSRVFLKGLPVPRAIKPVHGGILYVTPPNLWFVQVKNGKPGKRTLIDSHYTVSNNI